MEKIDKIGAPVSAFRKTTGRGELSLKGEITESDDGQGKVISGEIWRGENGFAEKKKNPGKRGALESEKYLWEQESVLNPLSAAGGALSKGAGPPSRERKGKGGGSQHIFSEGENYRAPKGSHREEKGLQGLPPAKETAFFLPIERERRGKDKNNNEKKKTTHVGGGQ